MENNDANTINNSVNKKSNNTIIIVLICLLFIVIGFVFIYIKFFDEQNVLVNVASVDINAGEKITIEMIKVEEVDLKKQPDDIFDNIVLDSSKIVFKCAKEPIEKGDFFYKDNIIDCPVVEEDDDNQIDDENNQEDSVDKETSDEKEVFNGYSGYQVIYNNDMFILNRNNKEVEKVEKNTLKIYKDKSDSNSKYTSVYCKKDESYSAYCSFGEIINDKYGYINTDDISIIYDVNTGKNKVFNGGYVLPVDGNDGIHFTYELSTDDDYIMTLVAKDGSLKTMPADVSLVGDGMSISIGSQSYSKSTKYIVVKKGAEHDAGLYGLYDYDLNKKIDFIYDDLNTISDELLIAEKKGKYGIIDASNNIVIDFKYDGIGAVDNYYVVLVGDKIGVIDKTGKEIIPINYKVYDQSFSLRKCCGNENSFSVEKKGSQVIVTYIDANKKNDSERYGYGLSYLVINSDNSYKKVDTID